MYIFACLILMKEHEESYKLHLYNLDYNTRNIEHKDKRNLRLNKSGHGANYYGPLFFIKLPRHIKSVNLIFFKIY